MKAQHGRFTLVPAIRAATTRPSAVGRAAPVVSDGAAGGVGPSWSPGRCCQDPGYQALSEKNIMAVVAHEFVLLWSKSFRNRVVQMP